MNLAYIVAALAASAVSLAQQNIDLTSKSAVIAAAKAAVWPLQQFYASNTRGNGAWIEQYDDSHWWESLLSQNVFNPFVILKGLFNGTKGAEYGCSGIYFDLFYKYMQYSGDYSTLSFVDTNMQLTVGGNGDFLDGQSAILEISGRWNDDIGWWALATMTAAETFGKDAIVAKNNIMQGYNPTYFSLANTTFEQIWMDWDTTKCGGGIYWSRIRTGNNANLKSTITNVEEMELGARLYVVTKDQKFKDRFDVIYAWLKTYKIVDDDYTVHDGLTTDACAVSQELYSYHTGELMAALGIMYQATNDQNYLDEAHKIFKAVQRLFVDPATNILNREPSCPDGTTASCGKSPSGYSFPVYKGLATLYATSTDNSVKASIATILQATAKVNFQGCDSNWYCIRNLPKDTEFTMQNGTNPRDQFETVSLLNALAVINGAGLVTAPGATVTTKSADYGGAVGMIGAALAGVLGGWILF
ncbi:hypothetical protein BCR33DRAFT_857774 [Rhizoclosmatium globosum]|uniref:Mannan endo-1,6-alpha-mannosidase n=1 Tax=Rhizoclosmatium globosum TaxID=329046 RepID=A0A1Y2B350_9FUNG|nr:hypothetical protein BCR33DRAFT_857774 [Rhizoclosmatium globosum]|eukprot:ORY29259.1 hypothetical protein BCR33DRAFT_857774 [Rhizoclosmatium globosum]